MKRTLVFVCLLPLLIICLVLFVNMTLFAQTVQRSRIAHITEKSAIHVPPAETPSGLKKIYSNLGTPNDLYLDSTGWFITGFNSYGGSSSAFAIALPFTPRSNSHISQVRVAVQYEGSGANQVNLSIYGDTGGVPGTLLAGPVTVTNLPDAGTCCTLAAASFTPLAVTGETQYWVVADAPVSGPGSDFVGVWDWDYKVLIFGGTNGVDGWVAENGDSLPAGEVLGTAP